MSRRPVDLPALVEGVASGRKRAVARAITLVENRDPLAYDLVRELYPRTGSAAIAGFTGPPGVGKSSLLGALVGHLREQGKRIGVVSVDPSSPFSKGALLGDRIRLADHFLDEGVFIRSMSTRGHLGGVAEATLQALLILDAAGMDVLLLETVGVGQSEVEVASVADTVVLVLQPGSGDSIQALKAGVMEIPDVIVINKSDHPAARTMRTEIRSVLSLDRDREWRVPIVETEALKGEGTEALWQAVLDHRAFLERDGGLDARRRSNIEHEVVAVAVAQARRRLDAALAADPELRSLLDEVHARRLDPLTATRQIADRVFRERDERVTVRPLGEARPRVGAGDAARAVGRGGSSAAAPSTTRATLPGFVAEEGGEAGRPADLPGRRRRLRGGDDRCLPRGRGRGHGALRRGCRRRHVTAGCRRVWLITTNDNLRALRFYQRRGFRLVASTRTPSSAPASSSPRSPRSAWTASRFATSWSWSSGCSRNIGV